MKRLRKKGFTEQDVFLAVAFAVIILIVLASMSGLFVKWFGVTTLEESCRLSVLANAKVRYSDLLIVGKNKERISINCPSKEDLEITYSDASSKTHAGTTAAVEYAIMKMVAEEMRECHYKYAGDVEGLIPFANEKGNYCGICRKIGFDKKIKETNFGTESSPDIGIVNSLYTYLLNAKMDHSTKYYSEFLYDYKKSTEERVEFASLFGSDQYDLDIDTSKDYYVAHLVIRDPRSWKEIEGYLKKDNEKCLALSGAIGVAGAILAPVSLGTSLAIGAAVGGAVMIGCKSTQVVNQDHDFVRFTSVLPVEDFNSDNINCVMYGLDKEEDYT